MTQRLSAVWALVLALPLFSLGQVGDEEKKAYDELKKRGARVFLEEEKKPGTPVTSVWLLGSKMKVTDKEMALLAAFPALRELTIEDAGITDEGLASLKGMKELRFIQVYRTNISDKGLEHLKDLPKLKNLVFKKVPLTDKGLASLREIPMLTDLWVEGTKITAKGVDGLKKGRPGLKVGFVP